ncbi:MAG: hypothetical protein PWP23_1008 [Candidatus Sumerlaeota bacterium]|nr:hypothetical protein [Candidatus Sumerlaeota bacterium]
MTGNSVEEKSSRSARGWLFYLKIALVAFAGCFVFTGGHLLSPDGELLYRTAESIALRGTLAVNPIEFDEATEQLLVPPHQTFATVLGRNGEYHVQYLPLQPLLTVPLVWLAKGTEGLFAEAFFRTMPGHPTHFTTDAVGTWRRAVTVALFNPLITALTALLLARIAMTLTGRNRRAAAWTALVYVFGTVALPHSRSYFTEPLAGLLALLAIDQLLQWFATPLRPEFGGRRLRQMVLLGGALGAGIWTRMDSPLLAFGIGLALVGAGELKRRREDAYGVSAGEWPWRDYLISGGLTLGAFALLIVFNQWRFAGNATLLGGGYSDQPEGVALGTPLVVGLHGLLASPGKGLFFFSPALLLGVWGWSRLPAHYRWLGLAMLVAYLPFAWAMAKWQNWDGGWCWGPRHLVQLHAPIMLGMVFLFNGCEGFARRVAIKVLAIAGFGAAVYGCLQAPMEFYHEFFRTPDDGLYYEVAYRPTEYGDTMRMFALTVRNPETGSPMREVSPGAMPAPLIDSLYLPQHTQWSGYATMLGMGRCDWWLLARVLPKPEQP